MNYYDVRILGTWCSIDLKRMCVITRPRNTYFYLVLYRWDELEKKYVIHTNRVAPNAANIDSTLFLELDFGINPNGERFPTNYIPIKYTFFNNDEMEICGISQTYFQKNIDVKTRSLTSNNTYRESVKENINNYGFFTDVNHFYRFKGEFPHDKRNDEMQVSSSSNDDAKAVLGLALLLFATTALFSDQSVTSPYPSQDIHKGETLGYDKDGEAIPSGGLRSTWDIKYDKDYKPKF